MLDVDGLTVSAGPRRVVDGVGFRLGRGDRVGLIGESGSGKSLTALALIGLLPAGCTANGSVRLDGADLLADARRLDRARGRDIAMVFQESLTALNPLVRVGRQVAEPLRRRQGLSRRAARDAAVELLGRVGLPEPAAIAQAHPGRLSGGQRQRACLALALACRPRLLIADEPTTALDTTVQAGILRLLAELLADDRYGPPPALLFISHDLAVVGRLCSRLLVMREGRVVESGTTAELLRAPRHPHTHALLAAARATALPGPARPQAAPGDPAAPGGAAR
ncbi:ABC transporter ATP-binding protein [Allonocardiopsis opalescens]|uniref:Peptide/nickel transport system ATP-binding protein n=1 Tax=Allonocardiopsis opalescens TaxID=1144618 RepID=A0A2T0QF08_9ACTN|nr:ABC transporter ATP-binding protein [Allonocardiopsis opalescens]PRY02433.1 peptide/nickel transport system ATP-binding protein [Allonocardiopsis opalescens]